MIELEIFKSNMEPNHTYIHCAEYNLHVWHTSTIKAIVALLDWIQYEEPIQPIIIKVSYWL